MEPSGPIVAGPPLEETMSHRESADEATKTNGAEQVMADHTGCDAR